MEGEFRGQTSDSVSFAMSGHSVNNVLRLSPTFLIKLKLSSFSRLPLLQDSRKVFHTIVFITCAIEMYAGRYRT